MKSGNASARIELISRVTDAVLDEVQEWQSRALERMYPIVIFDALRVKIRDADTRANGHHGANRPSQSLDLDLAKMEYQSVSARFNVR